MVLHEPQNIDQAKELMRHPRYWLEKDPVVIEMVARGFERSIGTQANVRASKLPKQPSGRKGAA